MFNFKEPPEYHYNKLRFGIIHPSSMFGTLWDFFNMLFVFLCVIIIPFDMAFNMQYDITTWIMNVIDVFFVADLLVNFCTAYYNNDGALEDRRRRICSNYLMGWFLLDFVSAMAGLLGLISTASTGEFQKWACNAATSIATPSPSS